MSQSFPSFIDKFGAVIRMMYPKSDPHSDPNLKRVSEKMIATKPVVLFMML